MTSEIDLLSVVLTLRPVTTEVVTTTAAAPAATTVATPAAAGPTVEIAVTKGAEGFGRAAHALLLDVVREADPALSESIHSGSGLRPFTVSDLIGYSPRKGIDASRTYALRFTAMTAPVTRVIVQAAAGGRLAAGQTIRLGEAEFAVAGVAPTPGPSPVEPPDRGGEQGWAAAATYESLSAPWLLGRAAPGPRIAFQFASPVTFKSNEKHVPLPMPGWVFGSLLDRWNEFAPVALPPETRRFAEECMALSSFDIRSRPMRVKEGGVRIGAVGIARYTAVNRDRYWLSVMNLLADFALFSGVGAGATMGLGQCRRF